MFLKSNIININNMKNGYNLTKIVPFLYLYWICHNKKLLINILFQFIIFVSENNPFKT